MLINKETLKKKKDRDKVLIAQLGGWVIESHCWGIPDNQQMQTCEWCGMKANTFARTYTSDEFKLCPDNPLIKEVADGTYDFYNDK